jgi:hypothetical protein
MGKTFTEIKELHQIFIENQKIFFVSTAPRKGRINLSPKGMGGFRVMDSNRVVWLNLTGSANETAAHLMEDRRMTVMFCSFEQDPMILRLYGEARAVHPRNEEWHELLSLFPEQAGVRQVIVMDVDLVHTSCGYGVPLFDYQGERSLLNDWLERKGEDGIRDYWENRNAISLDGKPTGIR